MRRLVAVTAVFIVVLVLVYLVNWVWFWTHLAQETGIASSSSRAYNFWSGIGSDLGEAALITGIAGMFRHHGCHAPRCWRLGRHPAAGGTYKLCRHHHPDLMGQRPTLELIHRHHREHRARQATR